MPAPRYGRRRERGLLVALSGFFSELRTPTTQRAKIIAITLAIVIFAFLGMLVIGGFMLSRVLNPVQAGETIDPTQFLGSTVSLDFQGPDGLTRTGWFFPGLRNAPLVVLCHGYKSSRSEILTLANSLQQHRYNVYVFNFAGHGDSPVTYTTLGLQETDELRAALRMLTGRDDFDRQRIGLWGYSLGAYAILRVAPEFPQVKAVALDSVYPSPTALLRRELSQLGANALPLLAPVTVAEFNLFARFYGGSRDVALDLSGLTAIPKLFIAGDDTPNLAQMTQDLHARAPGAKQLVVLPRTNQASLIEEERRNYENLVISFFLRNLPLVAPPS
ncbi:MAG: alpha/beta hydrolase [Candidatus Acidiferrales bacterium]